MSKAAPAPQQTAAAGQPDQPAATWDEHVRQTLAKLHSVYMTYVKPLEDRYKYDLFRPSWFEETILNQRPFITFFGPWSAGKSTFINHLLQSNYLWTGPQPTTAEFTVILHGEDAGPLDGRVLVNAKDLPFKGLNEFGEGFLGNFQGYQAPHDILKAVTLIDTPGVLESAKEIHQRKYDYIKLSRWFAERSDLIFVMFDPTKLDAGMELKMMFKHAFKGMENKVRIVLNKADSINTQELMRVYGSLFWNLSNMINSTEPPRVYVGSFWDQPYREGTFTLLFSEEKTDLIHELTEVIPAQALDKKVASLIKRAKDVFTHAVIVGGMRSELPMLFGKEKAKRKALDNLHITYEKVGGQYKMNWRDFPPVEEYRTFLEKFDLEQFPELEKVEKDGLLQAIRNCIDTVLPRMLRPVKHTAMLDPRNKDQRKDLQDKYHQSVKAQFEGKQGIQGSSDVVSNATRSSAVQNWSSPQSPSVVGGGAAASVAGSGSGQFSVQSTPGPQQQFASPPPQQGGGMMLQQQPSMMMMPNNNMMMAGGGAGAGGDPNAAAMQQQMMMQMMMQQMMLQQQQQQQGGLQPQGSMNFGMMMPPQQQQQPSMMQMQGGGFQQQPSMTFQPQPQPSMTFQPQMQPQPQVGLQQQGSMNFTPAPQQPQFVQPQPQQQVMPTSPAAAPQQNSIEDQQNEQAAAIQRQMMMMQQLAAQQQQQQSQQFAAAPSVAPSATAPSLYDEED